MLFDIHANITSRASASGSVSANEFNSENNSSSCNVSYITKIARDAGIFSFSKDSKLDFSLCETGAFIVASFSAILSSLDRV